MSEPLVGVLALQGDVREHVHALERVGARACGVRRPAEIARCDALVLPGGESTTLARLARRFEVFEPLRALLREGMPAFGTCAGMILLADRLLDGADGQETLGGLDVSVRRNAFGRQVDSFEGAVSFPVLGAPAVEAVFIRAPWVEETGPAVEVLARVGSGAAVGRIVATRQGVVLATSFHPEVGGDDRLHRYFVDQIVQAKVMGRGDG